MLRDLRTPAWPHSAPSFRLRSSTAGWETSMVVVACLAQFRQLCGEDWGGDVGFGVAQF